ncbi:MAG TPA: hypothetical protein VGU45_00255 [Microvirga sp.]|nr:hypothetical protein [Microvirga sp.]
MFTVTYDDARTAYMWIENGSKADDDRAVTAAALLQQEAGTLPPGTISRIKRIR